MENHITPAVLADLDIVEYNIKKAVDSLAQHHIDHRPHIKAHKSVELARLQISHGCKGITCAKLGEAEIMAEGGIDDILIAYPLIGADKLKRYARLVESGITVRTIINSVEGARGLSQLGESMGRQLPVLVELDGGINRGGLKMGEPLERFGKEIASLTGIRVEGVEYYGGDIYGCKTPEEIRLRARRERDEIVESARQLKELGFTMNILSGGSSFSILFPEELKGLTEVRAGNYIFHDNALFTIGMVEERECALKIVATVVARPDDKHAIMDAGSKTLTTDLVGYHSGYGFVLEEPEAIVEKLNEEHGFVYSPQGLTWNVGDQITIIPNHACTVPNLCDTIYGMRKGRVERELVIGARGKNQ